jgi:hypothetical protein
MNRTSTRKALFEALWSGILPQQVPDAEVLSGAALSRFGLPTEAHVRLPDLVAYSMAHSALFFIDIGPIDSSRLAELKEWSNPVICRRVYGSVFASRKDYVAQMDEQVVDTFVWFADEPKHHVFLSGSPQVSAEFLSARFAAK